MLLACAGAIPLAGCQTEQQGVAEAAAAAPRGPTVAFDSIDGLPPSQFDRLVGDLNEEAKARALAVLPRDTNAAYRVRGYFAATVEGGRTTVSWVWDVFDRNERRATRISGIEQAPGKDWNVADSGMLQTIARSSMQQLAAFLAAPNAPGAESPSEPRLALIGDHDPSPEAAGIFRTVAPMPNLKREAPAPPAKDSAAPQASSPGPRLSAALR